MLTGGHWVTWRQTGMLWDALMGRERLRHHHVVVTKSPITGLLEVGEGLEGVRRERNRIMGQKGKELSKRETQTEIKRPSTIRHAEGGVGLEEERA